MHTFDVYLQWLFKVHKIQVFAKVVFLPPASRCVSLPAPAFLSTVAASRASKNFDVIERRNVCGVDRDEDGYAVGLIHKQERS
jgi:hypothetical protein